MTRDEILNMPAGREADKLIAMMVFGFPNLELKNSVCPYCGDAMRFCGERSRCSTCSEWRYSPYKEYSSEIIDAWNVVEKVGSIDELHDVEIRTSIRGWFCNIFNAFDNFEAGAETAPLAICRAALLAAIENL